MEKINNYIVSSKKRVALLLAIVLTLSALLPGTVANAQEQESMDDIEAMVERFEEIEETTNEIDLEEIPVLEQVFSNDIENNHFLIQTALSNLNFEEKTTLEDEDGNFHIVVPIVNSEYNMLSNFTVAYDRNFNAISYVETHYQESVNGFFQVSNYLNGELIAETETEFEFIENEEFEEQLQEFENIVELQNSNPRLRSIRCTAGIIGIGLVVAGLLTAACLPWCIATVGSGCVACFGTFVAAAPAIIVAVVSCWR